MRQFGTYSIYVNDPSPNLEETRHRLSDEFWKKKDTQMWNWLESTGRRVFEIQPDSHPSAAQKAWEDSVIGQLNIIASNPVGKLVLDSIDYTQKVWILPFESGLDANCQCTAYTFPSMDPKEQVGIRIYYDPAWYRDGDLWIGSDDILLHELVHAYRISKLGYFGQNEKPLNFYPNGEEFFAVQMQNVYLGFSGSVFYYQWYSPLKKGAKWQVYDYYSSSEDALAALKYFLKNEKLAWLVSVWATPRFNQWRDFGALEKEYLDYLSKFGQNSYPPF